jgi:hypothetical protein
VEADMHQTYGIDIAAPGFLEAHSVRWLQARILGLLSPVNRLVVGMAGAVEVPQFDSRLHFALFPPKEVK